jgi:hypothetical protein
VTSLLIPSAVGLLAHKRLTDVAEALERKIGAGVYDAFFAGTDTVVVNDAERRVLALAKAAKAMFEAGPAVDGVDALPVGKGYGRFAVAGASAFELPAYGTLFERNGDWLTQTIRRGTPDENLSKVVVGSTQLAVRAGELGIGLTADDGVQARIQSFSMGMLSALASSVVVDPVLRGLQAQRTKRDWTRSDPTAETAAAEERIVGNLLGGRSGAASWQGWWPEKGDIPDALFDGYLRALEEAFTITASRPKGFGDFEEQFTAHTPPSLTRDRLRDGYQLARLDAQLASWGPGTWYLALLPLLVAPIGSYFLARLLPHGKSFFDRSLHVDERAVWELVVLGTGIGGLAPFGYSMALATEVPENREAFWEAGGFFVARVALTLGGLLAADDSSKGVRWGGFFVPLVALDLYGFLRGLHERSNGSPAGIVFSLQALPVLNGAVLLLAGSLVDGLIGLGVNEDVAYFAIGLPVLLGVVGLAIGLPLAYSLAGGGGLRKLLFPDRPTVTQALGALSETGGPAALAQLFDDSTLWFDPATKAPGPTLADLRYPAGRRALLRIWWTGDGDLQISHDEHTVTFKKTDGSTKDVVLPPGKTSAADLASLLQTQMPGIHAEPYDPADPLYDLPYPHTLTDPGDTQTTLADHDRHVHDFAPVGKSHDAAYVLRHTPRVELTTPYGELGPARSQLEAIELVPGQMLGDLEQSALGTAADLAVLLCMAAAPSLAGSAAGAGGKAPAEVQGPVTGPGIAGSVDPVFQVFRQWNLDERRVNEWRMLVQGGAEGDQPDPVHRDPAMRPNPVPGPDYASRAQTAAPRSEPIARALGWVPLWRAWSRMATDITADTSAATPMNYTPAVALRDGTRFQPSNADLTGAVRFLLDLP